MEPNFSWIEPRSGILLLSGYGIRISVHRGHLEVEDGVGAERRRARFARATAGFKRLVVIGHSGVVTIEAFRWLLDVGIPFVVIDSDGRLTSCTGPVGLDDARLRRAQALARQNGIGLGIARELINRKLVGQLRLLERLRDAAAISAVRDAIDCLQMPRNLDELRLLESRAAADYWGAWRDLDFVFFQRDANRVPEHWRVFGARGSHITGNPRKASNPANAILNYMYSILEGETRIAALKLGLDPGIGVMHADLKARDSLVCDLMEAVRPLVDERVLDLVKNRAFKKNDFFETREGVCRLMPSLISDLIFHFESWSTTLGSTTEFVAKALFSTVPTLLTEENRSRGRTSGREHSKR